MTQSKIDGVWGSAFTLFMSILFFVSVVSSEAPRTVNIKIYFGLIRQIKLIPGLLEISLRNLADNIQEETGSIPYKTFCKTEFGPVPMERVHALPENRNIGDIIKGLGLPCKEDQEKIYYLTDDGRIIYFKKETARGGYQS